MPSRGTPSGMRRLSATAVTVAEAGAATAPIGAEPPAVEPVGAAAGSGARRQASRWQPRSVLRVIPTSASARSWAGVRSSPAARAEAATASRVASTRKASAVGMSMRISLNHCYFNE